MKKIYILVAFAMLFGAGCSLFDSGDSGRYYYGPKTAPVQIDKPSTVYEDATKSIRVTNMYENILVPNGFVVIGEGVAFESSISWRVEDSTGNVLGHGYTMIAQPDAGIPGPFRIPVFFDRVPSATTGKLLVFENSAKDGSEIHVVTVPIALLKDILAVKVYFGNSIKNPNALDCSLVYPVTREVATGRASFVAVHELLKGPTESEKAQGYYTSIPEGVIIQDVQGKNGFAGLDFNFALEQGVGGSCRVEGIRSQIERTSAQEEGGDVLPIYINGRSEDILQP